MPAFFCISLAFFEQLEQLADDDLTDDEDQDRKDDLAAGLRTNIYDFVPKCIHIVSSPANAVSHII